MTCAMSVPSTARMLKEALPRPFLAAIANPIMCLRRDPRRFGVDHKGHWKNIQREATFVSPDLHTAFYWQVDESVRDYWCQFYTPGPGDTVIDVGAGIGEDAAVLSKLVGPTGKVVAIEAHPDTFACLQGTIALSGLNNVIAVDCAITDRDGTLTMSNSAEHLANSVIKNGGEIVVSARSLDSLLDELGIADVALLKMNIEGAEKPAMDGMNRAATAIRNVAISCHDFIADAGGGNQFRTSADVRAALLKLGFQIQLRNHAPRPWLRDTLFGAR